MRDHSERQEFFNRLCERNERRLLGIAKSYARGNEVGDLYQEIRLELWKSLDSYQGKSKLDTWVYRVALNTAIDFRSKTERNARGFEMVAEEQSPYLAGPRSELKILEEFIRSLGDVDRAIFLLYLERLSNREISEVTGLGENHVAVKINRLKKKFVATYIGN